MSKINLVYNDYKIRLITISDKEAYYRDGFANPDAKTNYYTNSNGEYTREVIDNYVDKIVVDETRYDFLIFDDEKIIGEVVLSNITDGIAHYRIAIFSKANFNKGIGFNVSKIILDYALENLGINQIELEVYTFNKRGISVYEKLGFTVQKEVFDAKAKAPYQRYFVMELRK